MPFKDKCRRLATIPSGLSHNSMLPTLAAVLTRPPRWTSLRPSGLDRCSAFSFVPATIMALVVTLVMQTMEDPPVWLNLMERTVRLGRKEEAVTCNFDGANIVKKHPHILQLRPCQAIHVSMLLNVRVACL